MMSATLKARRYQRLREIGEGAYGKAFLAKDNFRSGAQCVIKTIDVTRMNKKQQEACTTEVQLLARLEHPFIVRYLDSFVDANHLNIVLSYCPEGDLASVIKAHSSSNEPFSEKQILRWLAQMLIALKHIHSQRIIHRDIKSQNLLVDCDKRLRLADFGISKLLDPSTAQAQTFIGTPSYLSPELCMGERYGAATDIWSVGCVVYEIATFKTPFHMATSIPDLFYKINTMPIPPLPARYSAELQKLVDLMLTRDSHKRPTAAKLLQMPSLQDAVKGMLEEARKKTRKSERAA